MSVQDSDLTKGGILKKILLVALPIMGTQLLQMTYNLTDMFWLGRMQNSVQAVAASGLAGMFMWLGMALLIVGRIGAEIGVSQSLGAGQKAEGQAFAQQAARISLILGSIYGLLLLTCAGPLVSLLQVKEEGVFQSASGYLRIVALGVPLTYLSASLSGGFNGAGNSRLGFMANAVGLVVNMVLDPVMILGLNWGVQGAALATLIAQAIVCFLMVWAAKTHKERPFERFLVFGRLSMSYIRKIARWALPVSLESAAFTALSMVVTGMVSAGYGASAVAVQRVGSQIESLSWLIGGGFSSAVSAFMGQNYGAGKWARIRRGYRVSLGALLLWEAVVVLILVFLGRFLFALFLSEPVELVNLGRDYLMILAVCQLPAALEGTCGGCFRGQGRTLPPSLCSIASNILRPFLCYFLGQRYVLHGFWRGITLSASLRGLAIFLWYTVHERNLPHEDEDRANQSLAPA